MPSVFSENTHIQIRLIRNENQKEDDKILIRSQDDDTYQIFFRDGNMDVKKPATYYTVLSGEELDTYLESLFTLLVRDGDPFKEIQFNIPCYPTLMYPIQELRGGKLRSTLKTILPILSVAAKL
jgi:hypothetical protein